MLYYYHKGNNRGLTKGGVPDEMAVKEKSADLSDAADAGCGSGFHDRYHGHACERRCGEYGAG